MALPLVFASSSGLAGYKAVSVYNFLSRMIAVNEFCTNSEICVYIYTQSDVKGLKRKNTSKKRYIV